MGRGGKVAPAAALTADHRGSTVCERNPSGNGAKWQFTLLMVLPIICDLATVAAACPPPANQEESLIARYIWELRSNRQSLCEPGGDFLVDPAAINYSVPSFCSQVKSCRLGAVEQEGFNQRPVIGSTDLFIFIPIQCRLSLTATLSTM